MERKITSYHRDEVGDWVAELACGHNQHVRHRPPFQVREWVLDEAGRTSHLGSILQCPLCDRAQLPASLRLVRTTTVWNERTMPNGLRRGHRVAPGLWGVILVLAGQLRFHADTEPRIDITLSAGSTQPIPPGVDHAVGPVGPVQFSIQFHAIEPPERAAPADGSSQPQ